MYQITNNLNELKQINKTYNLNLTNTQIKDLIENKNKTLKEMGLIEVGETILKKIMLTFIDSPYIEKEEYVETIEELTNIFYTYRNEIKQLTDEEIINYLKENYNENYNGALELLETLGLEKLKNELSTK